MNLFLAVNVLKVQAQSNDDFLVVEGNVLGYELYLIRPFSNITFPVFLKVTKVVEGIEKSEYIMILLHNLYKEYAEENFGLDKITTLKIKRQNHCDTKMKYFFRSGSTIENGQLVKLPPTFTACSGR